MARDSYIAPLGALGDNAVAKLTAELSPTSRFGFVDQQRIDAGMTAEVKAASRMPLRQSFVPNADRARGDEVSALGDLVITPTAPTTGATGTPTIIQLSQGLNRHRGEALIAEVTQLGDGFADADGNFVRDDASKVLAKRIFTSLDAVAARYSADATLIVRMPVATAFADASPSVPASRKKFPGVDGPVLVSERSSQVIQQQLDGKRGAYMHRPGAGEVSYPEFVGDRSEPTQPDRAMNALREGQNGRAVWAGAKTHGRFLRNHKVFATFEIATLGFLAAGAIGGSSTDNSGRGTDRPDPITLPVIDRNDAIEQTLTTDPSDTVITVTTHAATTTTDAAATTTTEVVSLVDKYKIAETNRTLALRTSDKSQAFATEDGSYLYVEAMGEYEGEIVRFVQIVSAEEAESLAVVPYVANGVTGIGAAADSTEAVLYRTLVLDAALTAADGQPLTREITVKLTDGDRLAGYSAGADGKADLTQPKTVVFDGVSNGRWPNWEVKFDQAKLDAELAACGLPNTQSPS